MQQQEGVGEAGVEGVTCGTDVRKEHGGQQGVKPAGAEHI